jgi:hypothetical protein
MDRTEKLRLGKKGRRVPPLLLRSPCEELGNHNMFGEIRHALVAVPREIIIERFHNTIP